MGILNFKTKASEEIVTGVQSKRSRQLLPEDLHLTAIRKVQIIRAANELRDLMNKAG